MTLGRGSGIIVDRCPLDVRGQVAPSTGIISMCVVACSVWWTNNRWTGHMTRWQEWWRVPRCTIPWLMRGRRARAFLNLSQHQASSSLWQLSVCLVSSSTWLSFFIEIKSVCHFVYYSIMKVVPVQGEFQPIHHLWVAVQSKFKINHHKGRGKVRSWTCDCGWGRPKNLVILEEGK